MKQLYCRRLLFISKSLLWSILFYVTAVAVMDWEDMLARIKQQPVVLVKKTEQPVVSSPSVMHGIKLAGVVHAIWRQLVIMPK